ncbi:MAG: Vi polysaccharide biosynthesis protein VipB/TviC [candidate division Zixibacteria bacterium SM1_73]|nr:MAG: Vi polysaccharide biosynthesis protein VipB/TviC [candidate division Zixibacteria bacterium SM1_73]
MKYLVTGGAGFIGSNLVAELVNREVKVRVLDNFSTGRRENLLPLLDKIELIEGDLTDLETVREAVEGMHFVLHQGALPSIPRSIEHPIGSNNANVSGTLNLLVASRDAKVKRIVYASSSSVYGDSLELPKTETMNPSPLSPYAVSKLAGEYYCQVFYKVYHLESVVLRYFNVFGINQYPDSPYSGVIPRFISLMLDRKSPVIYGDGLQSRDFTFVSNVVKANLEVIESNSAVGETINIASGHAYRLLDLVAQINSLLGTEIEPIFDSPKIGEVRHSLADTAKAKQVFGYSSEIDFENGLKRMIHWMKSKKKEEKSAQQITK